MKSHEDYTKNDFAEKYILHQLTKNEELDFEEHLLLCEICRNEVQLLVRSVELIKATAHKSGVSFKNGTTTKTGVHLLNRYIGIAAAIIFLVAAAWFIFYYLSSGKYKKNMLVAKNEHVLKPVQLDTVAKIGNLKVNKVNPGDLKEYYTELSRFEILINNEYRSDGIDVTSPGIDQIYKSGEPIIFRWEKAGYKLISLVIFNNKGKIMIEQKIQPDFILKKTLEPGLYYWQYETEIESVYTGKIRIVK